MLHKIIDYIQLPENIISPQRWRYNPDDQFPNDPFIYVSFSINHLTSAYEDNQISQLGVTELDAKTVALFKTIIDREWKVRAKFPVEFLPNALIDSNFIKKKNICLIASSSMISEATSEVGAGTAAFQYPASKNEWNGANYKLILFPQITADHISNKTIFEFLHETGHAFAEFKHPINTEKGNNYPPFNYNLTCLDTIMVNTHPLRCPSVYAKMNQPFIRYALLFERNNPKTAEIIKLIEGQYPTQLGPVDLEAILAFIQTKNALDKTTLTPKKQYPIESKQVEFIDNGQYPPNKDFSYKGLKGQPQLSNNTTRYFNQFGQNLRQLKQSFFNQINSLTDSTLNCAARYAAEVVEECPTYFVKDIDYSKRPYHHQSSLSFFASHSEAVLPNSCLVGLLNGNATSLLSG